MSDQRIVSRQTKRPAANKASKKATLAQDFGETLRMKIRARKGYKAAKKKKS